MSPKKKKSVKVSAFIVVLLLVFNASANAQITWPEGQLLPSFPAPAATQDLIYLNGSIPPYAASWIWQAETTSVSHNTGHLETDGWLCQVGVDTPNQYMIYGPNDRRVTAGPNFADFRMKIDNNTLNDDVVVNLDVRNATTGTSLAAQAVTRSQFTTAGSYMNFRLNFQMPADSQKIELRVFWTGKAAIKVDRVSVTQDNADAEMYLFSSLKGLVNRKQPRIFSYEGDAFAEGPYTWLQSLGVGYTERTSNTWAILTKYISEVSGLIVYDPDQIHTVNLATMLAKDKNALVASPSLVAKLTAAPYNLPILTDLRGKFTSKLQVYQTLFDSYWPSIDHRLLIGLSPTAHKASLREYAVALGAAVVWLDPKVTAESVLLNKFLSSMPDGANFMGWWPEEAAGVTRVSLYGITTIASDYCTNLTFHSGTSRAVEPKPMPAKPTLQNKIYVAFILSDGDNLQYIEHLMRKLWKNADRGSVPMGWTLSPAMLDAMPGALNYYHKTSTVNDNLISGPSGYGYTYPNNWNFTDLNRFVAKTEDYNFRAGFRVITIWNTITGGINSTVGTAFANYAPTLLGLTAQNTGGPLSIYKSTLPGLPLSCNYGTDEQALKDHIASAAAGWVNTKPRFIVIQAQPWTNVTPTTFKNVKNSLNSNYVVVRPDHLFQLLREANHLSINPGGVEGTGTGLKGTYFNGTNFETEVGNRLDTCVNFNWGTNSPMTGVNPDGFSVRWTGSVQPRYSGTYTFYSTCDNGCRVWVNDQLIIDRWTGTSGTTYTGTIPLTAGQKYSLKVEYFENDNSAGCKLEWASPFQSREIVPKSQLYDIIQGLDPSPVSSTGISIAPNPVVNGMLNVETRNLSGKDALFTLYDLTGKALLNKELMESKQQISVAGVAKGFYIASVSAKGEKVLIEKIEIK